MGSESGREILKIKLRDHFDGKIVRKDLTKHIKEGANVPVYVLEYLLGQYCNSEDEEVCDSRPTFLRRSIIFCIQLTSSSSSIGLIR